MKKLIILSALFLGVACTKPIDNTPVKTPTTKFYRIKEVDKDGNVTYSKVITVKK